MVWSSEADERLYDAFEQKNLSLFRSVMHEHPDNVRSESGYDAWLWLASEEGLFDFVTFLVEEMGIGPDELTGPFNPSQVSPADYALRNGHRELAIWLLERGAQINYEYEGKRDCPILKTAAAIGDLELVKWLVEHGADVNAAGQEMRNALMRAGTDEVRDYLRSVGGIDLREAAVTDLPASHQKLLEAFDRFGEQDGNWGRVLDWKMNFSGAPNIEVHCVAPSNEKQTQLLVTVGMSDVALNPGGPGSDRLEFMHVLPADWPLDETAEVAYWDSPMVMLNNLARMVLARRKANFYDRPPDWSRAVWSIEMNDDPTKPIAPGTHYTGCLLRSVESWTMPDHRKVGIYEVISVYSEEAEFLRERQDYQPLILRFRELEIEREFALNRLNAVTDWPAGKPEPTPEEFCE